METTSWFEAEFEPELLGILSEIGGFMNAEKYHEMLIHHGISSGDRQDPKSKKKRTYKKTKRLQAMLKN